MDESNDNRRVIPELYFLIAKFLSGGPLKETAKTLLRELERVEVLPRRIDWLSEEHAQSYEELESRFRDIEWTRLPALCGALVRAAGGASPPRPLPLPARTSLLADSLVRPRVDTSVYSLDRDHSLVRRLAARETGRGNSAALGGRGGSALLSPRILSGLQLQRRTLGHLSAVYCLAFDCTGRYVITGADDLLVKVWSAVDGRLRATLRGAGAEITDCCVSGDGALLAAGSVERLVRVWCLRTAAPRAVLHAHQGTITSVHWAPLAWPDVRWLASTSTDGSVALWTCSRDGQFLSQPVHYVERMRPGACHMICAAWSAGGGFLAAGSADQHVRVYAVGGAGAGAGGAPRRVLELAVHSDAVDSLAWAHVGLRFVSGSKDGTAAIWTLHATQWRHQLLRCLPLDSGVGGGAPPGGGGGGGTGAARVKVTMVCWDRCDQYVLTAVCDTSVRVWCARTLAQIRILRGHRDQAYVLEPHPLWAGVVLSAGHDGQLLVWDAPKGELLASFHNDIASQGDGAIFDAKWGGLTSIAATDSHGHLLLLGLGKGHKLLSELPAELFFHTDYRPLVRDALGGALDEQTELPPHLMPPPFLVDVEGAPHPPHVQRLVPGRQALPHTMLVPNRLDEMIEALAAERTAENNGDADVGRSGPWRGEGVRRTRGRWEGSAGVAAPNDTAPIVPPLPHSQLVNIEETCAALNAWESAWWRREMRRRPLMISTPAPRQQRSKKRPMNGAGSAGVQRPYRPLPLSPLRGPSSGSSASLSDGQPSHSDSSLSSGRRARRRKRRPRQQRAPRTHTNSQSSRNTVDTETTCSYSSGKTEEMSESSPSEWEVTAEPSPPQRARRRKQPPRRYDSDSSSDGEAPLAAKAWPGPSRGPEPPAGPASPLGPAAEARLAAAALAELGADDERYRVGEWLAGASPRKAPYQPQLGDIVLYFRQGHQRYFEAVAEKDVYPVRDRDKPWQRGHVRECELGRVASVRYKLVPPRVALVQLAVSPGPAPTGPLAAPPRKHLTVRYHDMPDVIDFLVLLQQYTIAKQRRWAPGDRFRCMIDDSWWTGIVLETTNPNEPEGPEGSETWLAAAAARWLSIRVRWDNGEVERLSPWDLEPIDVARLPSEMGGAVPVLPSELEAVLYRPEASDWPPTGDRAAACRALTTHVSQMMTLAAAEPFVAPVDLTRCPEYARSVPYPIDLCTIRARFQNLWYRRSLAAEWDARQLAACSPAPAATPRTPCASKPRPSRTAKLLAALLVAAIREWQTVDVVAKYRELCSEFNRSSDDEPLAAHARRRGRDTRNWQSVCADVLKQLQRSADAPPFLAPVDVEQVPDYLTVISKPIDLGTISQKLEAGRYSRPERFAEDVRRVFSNSRLYNTNKRSRIYSMTVRLSALWESLWTRAALSPRRTRRTARFALPSDRSDSDTPLRAIKGKGVGKRSRDNVYSEPQPGPSRLPTAPLSLPPPPPLTMNGNGLGLSDSEWGLNHRPAKRPRRRTKRRSSDYTSDSSSNWSDNQAVGRLANPPAPPEPTSSDDEPLHLYRRRQEAVDTDGEAGPSTPRRTSTGSGGRVSLRARTSRRYNEDSEEDSVACISKRLPHHHRRRSRQRQLSHRSRTHAHAATTQLAIGPAPVPVPDHNYFNGAHPSHPVSPQPPSPPEVSVSMRGRVRRLTAKARGLLRQDH